MIDVARTQRKNSATLLKISDADLIRHEALAYNDGYADAREYGQDGFFMPEEYGAGARESYLQGFHKGLRVFRVHNSLGLRRFD